MNPPGRSTMILIVIGALVFVFLVLHDLEILPQSFEWLGVAFFALFVGVLFYLWWTKKKDDHDPRDVLYYIPLIKARWLEDIGHRIVFDPSSRGSTSYFEGVNFSYYSYRFIVDEADRTDYSDVIIIVDVGQSTAEKVHIADFDMNPASERRVDPFLGFNPWRGQYVERRDTRVDATGEDRKRDAGSPSTADTYDPD